MKNSFLEVAHINSSSLVANIEDVRDVIIPRAIDIIGVSETWAKANITSNFLSLHNYTIFRHDRLVGRGGGVAIYVRYRLNGRVVFTSNSRHCRKCTEILGVSILLNGGSGAKLLVVQCSRAPDVACIEKFCDLITLHAPSYDYVFVMGDFNVDWDSRRDGLMRDELEAVFTSLNLHVVPTSKTHHAPNSSSRIDLLVTSHPTLIDTVMQTAVRTISRHDLVQCRLRISYSGILDSSSCATMRRYNQIDQQSFRNDIMNTPWGLVLQTPYIEDKVDILNKLIISLFDKHAPLIPRKQKGWKTVITPEIRLCGASEIEPNGNMSVTEAKLIEIITNPCVIGSSNWFVIPEFIALILLWDLIYR